MKIHEVDGKEYIFNGRMDGMYGKCTTVESKAPMLIHVGIEVIKIERDEDATHCSNRGR